jgi:hypothetical protein
MSPSLNFAIPGSPLSVLSDLSLVESRSNEDHEGSERHPNPPILKIRIPRPLNMAVATATKAAKTPSRRSSRRTSSRYKIEGEGEGDDLD